MRPTRPKPMTPMPTRSLAPTTRFQEEAPRAAAAVPALIKVRRVSSFCGFGVDARVGGFISRRGWQRRGAEARGAMAWLFRVHAERVNDWNEFSIPSARGCFPPTATGYCPRTVGGLVRSAWADRGALEKSEAFGPDNPLRTGTVRGPTWGQCVDTPALPLPRHGPFPHSLARWRSVRFRL